MVSKNNKSWQALTFRLVKKRNRGHTGSVAQARYCVAVVGVLLLLNRGAALAQDYRLLPIIGMGRPVERGVAIVVSTPKGWTLRNQDGRSISFVAIDDKLRPPTAELAVNPMVLGEFNSTKEGFYADPMHSLAVAWLRSAGNVTQVKKLEVFDGGQNGKLPLWRIRSTAYNLYLVLISRGAVVVDISLSADRLQDLKKHTSSLKELVRSIHIVKAAST
jgi:hypothetical protein